MKKFWNLTANQCRQAVILLLTGITAAGVIAGSAYTAWKRSEPSVWVHQNFLPQCGSNILLFAAGTSLSLILFAAAVFIAGSFALGQPVGIILLLYRGFGIGAASAASYFENGIHAVPEVIVLILPKAMASVMISVLAVRELLRSSNALLSVWKDGDVKDGKHLCFRAYCFKFAVLLLLSLIITLADLAINLAYRRFS